eukprot:6204904-Pleurochrysis_carterae.AAC.4
MERASASPELIEIEKNADEARLRCTGSLRQQVLACYDGVSRQLQLITCHCSLIDARDRFFSGYSRRGWVVHKAAVHLCFQCI